MANRTLGILRAAALACIAGLGAPALAQTTTPSWLDASILEEARKDGSVTVKGKTVFVSMVVEKEITSDVKVKGFPTFVLKKANGATIESDADRTPDGLKAWLAENV